jgi:signal transduction histidine kinase/CheY-like chemotaxis protein
VQNRFTAIADAPGPGGERRVRRIVGTLRDVTRRQELEAEREALLHAERAARGELIAAGQAKDEFLATISHELRTPLNAIFGWVKLLRSGRLDQPGQARAIDVIERNTRAQAQLIDDLLDMSRVITGNLRLERSEIELGAILEAVVETLRPAAEAKQLELALVIGDTPAVVLGDPGRLQQIMWNLLANSIKFTPQGGRIEAKVSMEDGEVQLRVTDTGVGIDREFLPHVFEQFRQGASSESRAYGGLGIGLSLVRHLVELHGGWVSAQSEGTDRGACFIVRLPGIAAHGSAASRVRALHPHPVSTFDDHALDRMRVLVVDDDEDARDLLRAALSQAGAHVTTAAAVREALDQLEAAEFDVLLSDIAMPNGTGYDLLRAVRASPRTAALPAVALTAYSRAEDRERILRAGFNFHIGKPFELAVLVRMLAIAAGREPSDDRAAIG